jgi:hypothetical protein
MDKKFSMGALFVLCRIVALVTGGAGQLVMAVEFHGMAVEALPERFRWPVCLWATGEEQGQNDEGKNLSHLSRLESAADAEKKIYML